MKNLIRSPFAFALQNSRDEFLTPFSSLFDEILETNFPQFKYDCGIQFSKMTYPKVDVEDLEDSVNITAEIAGWDPKDISVEVENLILSISGKTSIEKEKDDKKFILKELKRSSFRRTFTLSDKLDLNSVSATFDKGLLNITIAKRVKEEPKETKIQIQIK